MISNTSPAADKVALFRSLFRGRTDVYPRRFENRKTKKSGYAPACSNEWVPGICKKPKIKRLDAVLDIILRALSRSKAIGDEKESLSA